LRLPVYRPYAESHEVIRSLAAVVIALHLLVPAAAWAQDKVKNPLDYSLKQYSLFLGIALLGGFVSWYSKVRSGLIPWTSLNHLVGELCTSAFAGLLCFWICEWSGFPPLLTGALTGIMGHMGTRGITVLEEWATKRFSASDPGKPTA
jgi:hypothetical protein